MANVFYPNNANSGVQNIAGRYVTGKTRRYSAINDDVPDSDSGTPFPDCCGGDGLTVSDVCQITENDCNVGVEVVLESGRYLQLKDGAGDILSTVPLPTGTGGIETITSITTDPANGSFTYQNEASANFVVDVCELVASGCEPCRQVVDYGVTATVPTGVPAPASHHYWAVNAPGNLDFTPSVDGELSSPIAGAGDCDEYHFVNIGSTNLFFTNEHGIQYTFNSGDIMSFVRETGTDNYMLI